MATSTSWWRRRADEPFGLTVPEAGSYGLPVVAARSGAFPELIEDEHAGLLFEAGATPAALRARSSDWSATQPCAGAWARAARAHVGARFTIEGMTERFLSGYIALRSATAAAIMRVPITISRMSLATCTYW